MKISKTCENNIAAYVMAVAVCFAFFAISTTAVHAEEDTDTVSDVENEEVSSDDSEKRAAMMKQIEALREALKEKQEAIKEGQEEKKEEFKAAVDTKKAEFKINKEEFMASLEGLSDEERKAAMLEFITDVKAQIEAFKAAMKEQKEVMKEERIASKEEFKASLEGLSQQEKIAAIIARVSDLKLELENGSDDEDELEDEDEDEDELEDEDEDELEDEDDDSDDEDDSDDDSADEDDSTSTDV